MEVIAAFSKKDADFTWYTNGGVQAKQLVRSILYSTLLARETVPLVARLRNSSFVVFSSCTHLKPPGCEPRALNSSLEHRYEVGVKCARAMVHLRAMAYAWSSAVKHNVPTLGLSGGGGLKAADNQRADG